MSTYNFDTIIDRSGTHCKKTDLLEKNYGTSDLIPLWIADMDFAVCPEITRALTERFGNHPIYGYTVTYDEYWQSIIDWQRRRNGFVFTRDDMTFIPGGVTALGMVLNFFTRPGDRVMIQNPVYYDFREVIEGNGRIAVSNELVAEDGFYHMDLDALERQMIEQQPKLMVVCNPQNPIGIVWEKEVLQQVAAMARRHGVLLFSDEVFSDLTLFGHRHTPLATVSDDAAAVTITCGSPGKSFNIAGFKSTWLVIVNPELRRDFFRWIEVNELNMSNITALVATEAGYRNGEQWLEQCKRYVEQNVLFVEQFCRERIPGIRAVRPQASFLMWLDCTGLGLEHQQVIDLFVKRARLALNDGSIYGEPGMCHLRLNVGTPRARLEQALARLEAAVKGVKL